MVMGPGFVELAAPAGVDFAAFDPAPNGSPMHVWYAPREAVWLWRQETAVAMLAYVERLLRASLPDDALATAGAALGVCERGTVRRRRAVVLAGVCAVLWGQS